MCYLHHLNGRPKILHFEKVWFRVNMAIEFRAEESKIKEFRSKVLRAKGGYFYFLAKLTPKLSDEILNHN